MSSYFVYILASKTNGTLYIGVTNDILGRVKAHKEGSASKFTSKYRVDKLVYVEEYAYVDEAIQRETSLKRYKREWKLNLIESDNPRWLDLYPGLRALPGNQS